MGETDGGKMLSEQEFERLKIKALKAKQNELHVYFRNSDGIDCRVVGPQSQCFCSHKYRDHNWFDTETKIVHCRVPGCRCNLFEHIPVMGRQDIKCNICKHSYLEHNVNSRKCQSSCRAKCNLFVAAYRCACNQSFENHCTVFETKKERLSKGLPVSNGNSSVVPTGGLSSMLDLVDGVDREELHSHLNLPQNMQKRLADAADASFHVANKNALDAASNATNISSTLVDLASKRHSGGGMGSDSSNFRQRWGGLLPVEESVTASSKMGLIHSGASSSFKSGSKGIGDWEGREGDIMARKVSSSSGVTRRPSLGFSERTPLKVMKQPPLYTDKNYINKSNIEVKKENGESLMRPGGRLPPSKRRMSDNFSRQQDTGFDYENGNNGTGENGMHGLRAKAKSYRLGGPR